VRLAISNIAWDVAEDTAVAEVLQRHQVDAIDIAPGKYFADPVRTPGSAVTKVRDYWVGYGIEITGMQALLFGTQGLNVFGDATSQAAMLNHLTGVCRIASGLRAARLVFGSPKNRDCSGIEPARVKNIAVDFFRQLGNIAENEGVLICLEPNPPCYGANFMVNSSETAAIVEAVNHPAIRMQLDTGAMTINEEAPETVINNYAHLIGHIHASEPSLVTLGEGKTDHVRIAECIRKKLANFVVSIEMVASTTQPHVTAIERALQVADCYRHSL
jgi:sugar phosphate isomerase/epimerase